VHKRIEIVVRNIGYESTVNAMGALSLDFEDETALERATEKIRSSFATPVLPHAIFSANGNSLDHLVYVGARYESRLICDDHNFKSASASGVNALS
jgi:hypothetical protein